MKISVQYEFLPKQNSVRASQVMDHFGINFEMGQHTIVEELELPIKERPVEKGQVVCFTGESGSGKSSLMRVVSQNLDSVLDINSLPMEDKILVDSVPQEVEKSLGLFASCGLGEAHLLLRTPGELSDGQRYRFRLAKGLSESPDWLMADEFTATLDRTLAKVIAFNIRRIADRTGTGFLLATTHEDILGDLNPDLHIRCALGCEPTVVERDGNSRKKKGSVLQTTSPS